MNINLHIECLILDGVDIKPGQQKQLQAAVISELSRLLATGGLSSPLLNGRTLPRVASPAIQLNHRTSTTDTGQKIARAVYGGIGR